MNASHLSLQSQRNQTAPETHRFVPPLQGAVPEAVPVVELPINQVALHQVDVVPADTTAAAADIPTLCQDPFLWEEAVVSGQRCGLCTA